MSAVNISQSKDDYEDGLLLIKFILCIIILHSQCVDCVLI